MGHHDPDHLVCTGSVIDTLRWVRSMWANTESSGNYWNSSIQSTIISHTLNETASFTPSSVNSSDTFTEFLKTFLPGDELAPIRLEITAQYDCTEPPYNEDYQLCIATVIRDSIFTCNTRDLYSAYPDVSYMMRYGFPNATLARHAADLIALFANNDEEVVEILGNQVPPEDAAKYAWFLIDTNVSLAYQTYFASFALSGGDPNTLDMPQIDDWDPPAWPVANGSSGDELTNVLTVQLPLGQFPFVLEQADDNNSKTACDFWTKIAGKVVVTQEAKDVVDDGEKRVYSDEL